MEFIKNPRILLFGGNGWIGSKVFNLLKNMGYNVEKASSRADDFDSVTQELEQLNSRKNKITHVMSFIGRTHGTYESEIIPTIDYLEKPGKLKENINDNLYAPIILASICKKYNCHFTYLGTGCIFDYDDVHPFWEETNGFKEDDKPNFFGSSYSIVKGYTDRLFHELYNDATLNVRIRMPITSEISPRNFITKITNYKKICSIPNSMTVLDNLLPVLIQYSLDGKTGTVNLCNPGLISHNEILEMYKEIVDSNFEWENFSIDEQNNILPSKRSNNFLDTALLETTNTHNIKPIKEAVRDVLLEMKQNL